MVNDDLTELEDIFDTDTVVVDGRDRSSNELSGGNGETTMEIQVPLTTSMLAWLICCRFWRSHCYCGIMLLLLLLVTRRNADAWDCIYVFYNVLCWCCCRQISILVVFAGTLASQ